jgi:hypothetical protein
VRGKTLPHGRHFHHVAPENIAKRTIYYHFQIETLRNARFFKPYLLTNDCAPRPARWSETIGPKKTKFLHGISLNLGRCWDILWPSARSGTLHHSTPMSTHTTKQVPLSTVKMGEYLTLKLNGPVYVRQHFDRESKTYSLGKTSDMNHETFKKGKTLVFVGFEY